jgi:uncharacterized protein with HEPN domain
MPDAHSYLWDIQDAAQSILTFVKNIDATIYAESELIHSAVERKFEVIGEALNSISRLDPELAERIPEFRRIIAFRNVLVHGYAVVEHDRVWDVVQNSLPMLLKTVSDILDEKST